MAGRPEKIDTSEILREFALSPDPVLTVPELVDMVDMSRQGIDNRLKKMQRDGYVTSKKPGRDRIWWITEEGHAHLRERRSD